MRDILTQRTFQIGSGCEDGNDSNLLRHEPMFCLGVDRKSFDPEDMLASGATIFRSEHAATSRVYIVQTKPWWSESVPTEDAQTQVDGRRIKRINGLFQPHREAIAGVKLSGNLDKIIAKSM